MKPFTTLAILIFTLVTIAHLIRYLFGWEVEINGIVIPLWVSLISVFVTALLAIMLWRENRK